MKRCETWEYIAGAIFAGTILCLSLSAQHMDAKGYSRHSLSPEIQASIQRAKLLLDEGRQARRTGDLQTAETKFKECIQEDTSLEAFAQEELAQIYEGEGRINEAIQAYHNLLHRPNGQSPGTWGRDGFTLIHYAIVLNKSGRWPEAVQAYEEALKSPSLPDNDEFRDENEPRLDVHFDPSIPQPKEMSAMLHVVLGRRLGNNYSAALPYFEAALATDPNLAIAQFYKGYALNREGRFAEAKKAFALAADLGNGPIRAAAENRIKKAP